MAARHRDFNRDFDRSRGRAPGGSGGGRDRGDATRGREPRDGRDQRPLREPRTFGGPPPYRERRPPAPPEEVEDFEAVDAGLAVAILETAARLTEMVGTAGLPEGHAERREAVIESFEAIYTAVLDAVTGDDEEE